jgi:DNA (cytosine-5)-methyltransferase 1
VRSFDGTPWRGHVDIITGGFPCQDISSANAKGQGITGEKSGLWREMARIIGEVLPTEVLIENSPMLRTRGLGLVLGDLAGMGYDAAWGIIGAYQAGAPHYRKRMWILAHLAGAGCHQWKPGSHAAEPGRPGAGNVGAVPGSGDPPQAAGDVAHVGGLRCNTGRTGEPLQGAGLAGKTLLADPPGGGLLGADHQEAAQPPLQATDGGSQASAGESSESGVVRVADGIPDRVDGIGTLGTAQVVGLVPETLLVDLGGGGCLKHNPKKTASADDAANARSPAAGWWPSESGLVRVADGIPNRVDRIRALGNAQVPRVVALAYATLSEILTEGRSS